MRPVCARSPLPLCWGGRCHKVGHKITRMCSVPRYVIKIKIAIPVAVGKWQSVSVRYILCKSKSEFMAIELNWNWFAAPASRGCTLPVACCLLPYTVFCWCFSAAVAACDAKKYATLLVAWQASDRRQTTRQTCHGNLWARRQLPINYVHVRRRNHSK